MREKIQLPLPALITLEGEKAGADPASLRSLQESFSAPSVTCWDRADLDVDLSLVGWRGSATLAKEYAAWNQARAGEMVEGKTADAAKRILRVLQEHNLLGR